MYKKSLTTGFELLRLLGVKCRGSGLGYGLESWNKASSQPISLPGRYPFWGFSCLGQLGGSWYLVSKVISTLSGVISIYKYSYLNSNPSY